MTNNKKALALSILSMLMCCAMLIGSTFAWFTDTETAGVNSIVAGNLDIELQDVNGETLAADAKLFKDFKWEPGAVLVSDAFKVANVGTLALTYDLSLKVNSKNTLNGHALDEVIKVAVVDKAPASRDAALALEYVALSEFKTSGVLLPEENKDATDFVVVLYWEPTDHDNDYNVNNGKTTDDEKDALTIEFGVSVFATQTPYESDSFDENYDAAAHATQDILATVEAGVGKLNIKMLKDDGTPYATLSPLKNVDGVYTSDVTILDEEQTVLGVFNDIADTLFGEVASQSAKINSITISVIVEDDVISGTPYENNGKYIDANSLLNSISPILNRAGINGATTIDYLDGVTITVAIEDVAGVTTTYALVFALAE